jgi:hypothetical protein
VPLARLTWPQTLRVVGVVFVLMLALGRLPAAFALPAGIGDLAVGLAAPAVALRLARGDRRGATWFHALGLLDLAVAVTLGLLAALGPGRVLNVSPSTADVSLHVASLARLRARRHRVAAPLPATIG